MGQFDFVVSQLDNVDKCGFRLDDLVCRLHLE